MGALEKARKATSRSDKRDKLSGDEILLLGAKNTAAGVRVNVDE